MIWRKSNGFIQQRRKHTRNFDAVFGDRGSTYGVSSGYIILGSFKENAELLRGGTNLFPEKFILDNYKEAWEKANFARYTFNSIVISVGVMCVTLVYNQYGGVWFSPEKISGEKNCYIVCLLLLCL